MKSFVSSLLAFLGLGCSCGSQSYQTVDVPNFASMIKSSDVTLLDVRTPSEFSAGHISGALNIDVQSPDFLTLANQQLDKQKTVAVYCRSGRRSAKASQKLASAGYNVVNLKGGIEAWKADDMMVSTMNYERDEFSTNDGRKIEFYALMHASIYMVYDGLNIYIDPVRKLGDREVDYSSMPKADYIFVTHEHGDHFDQEALRQLTDSNTRLITNNRCAEMLGSGEVMKNGDNLSLSNDMKIEAVPAYNTTDGHQQFHPKGRDNGFIVTLPGKRIYIAGDTEDIPEMAEFKNIDIAFLPCNQPYTMTTDQLVKAAKILQPKVLFPYHYGNTDVSVAAKVLEGEDIDVRIRHYE